MPLAITPPSAEDQLTITAQLTPNKQESLDTPAPSKRRASYCAKAGAAEVRLRADERDWTLPGGTADLAKAEIDRGCRSSASGASSAVDLRLPHWIGIRAWRCTSCCGRV